MKQVREVQTWRQVRGPAAAVMCETRDLGIKWLRNACPKDVKNMLLQQARKVYWKKWAAKHEYEELEEGIWLEPALALLRKKTKDDWTEKHRNVARKVFLEGGWVQKQLFDIGWSDESECQACRKEEGTEKHRLHHCPGWNEGRCQIPEACRKTEQNAKTSKKEWKWQRGIVTQWNRGHFGMEKWESEKHKSCGMPAEVFKGHVVTDGSLLGPLGSGEHVAGQWCDWIMMKNWGPCMGCTAQWRQNSRFSEKSRGPS